MITFKKRNKSKLKISLAIHITLITIITSTPIFLPGALNTLIFDDIKLSYGGIGFVFTLYWTGSVIGAHKSRSITYNISINKLISFALFGTFLSLLLMSFYPQIGLLIGALIGGFVYGYSQPFTNYLILKKCHASVQGFAFGLKQAAIPLATLICSLSIPLVAIPLGWRKVFEIIAVISLLYAIINLLTDSRSKYEKSKEKSNLLPINNHLICLAVAGGCGAMIGNSLGGFLIVSFTHEGIPISTASLVAASASIVNIIVRVLTGTIIDKYPHLSNVLLIGMFVTGILGTLLLISPISFMQILGALLAYGGGWGWAGLLHFVTGKSYPGYEAQATAVSQIGVSIGAAVGPLLFSLLFYSLNSNIAWGATALAGVIASLSVIFSIKLNSKSISTGSPDKRSVI